MWICERRELNREMLRVPGKQARLHYSKAAALLGTCKEDAKLCCGYVGDKAEETEVKKVRLWFFVFFVILDHAV